VAARPNAKLVNVFDVLIGLVRSERQKVLHGFQAVAQRESGPIDRTIVRANECDPFVCEIFLHTIGPGKTVAELRAHCLSQMSDAQRYSTSVGWRLRGIEFDRILTADDRDAGRFAAL